MDYVQLLDLDEDAEDYEEVMQSPYGRMAVWMEREVKGYSWLKHDRICFEKADEARRLIARFGGSNSWA